MSDKKQTAFRISEVLLKRLKAEAKKQNRSINNLVDVLIDKHVPKLQITFRVVIDLNKTK